MKIVLLEHPRIESDEHYNDVANAPLSACLTTGYVAAMLEKNGHAAVVHDCVGLGFNPALDELAMLDMDVLGVHAVYIWEHTHRLFLMLEKFSQLRPDVKIVLFGIFPTFSAERILDLHDCVHAVILGEPEIAFLKLIEAFAASANPVSVEGLVIRDRQRIVRTPARKLLENIDVLPAPLRTPESLSRIGGSILGSRGCLNACSFCCINAYYGAGPVRRRRSPENILREIEAVLPALERRSIYFLDADFFGSGDEDRARALRLASGLGGLSLEFGCECRSGSFDESLLAALSTAGLRHVFLGIESASRSSLQRMRKGLNPDVSAGSLRLLRGVGIEPDLGFIMFDAEARLADIRENFDFLKSNGLLGRLSVTANVLYHREIALRGMQNFARLAAAGRLTGSDSFGYEGRYLFSDPAVRFLADLMSYVCRRVLRATDNARSPICWKRGESAASRRVNDYMAGLFEATLRSLELGEVRLDFDGLLRAQDDALCSIEGLIVEERVCQP